MLCSCSAWPACYPHTNDGAGTPARPVRPCVTAILPDYLPSVPVHRAEGTTAPTPVDLADIVNVFHYARASAVLRFPDHFNDTDFLTYLELSHNATSVYRADTRPAPRYCDTRHVRGPPRQPTVVATGAPRGISPLSCRPKRKEPPPYGRGS